MIQDSFGRIHDYLRISLTDFCNLKCMYCMPEEGFCGTHSPHLMSRDEIVSILIAFVEMGVRKVRLTGGEPLVRKDFGAIVEGIRHLPVSLHLTTNGVLLNKYIDLLWESGIHALNISLDTLRPERYLGITKCDLFHPVMENIYQALNRGFKVKLNVVVIKGVNEDELWDFVKFSDEHGVGVRFIEFMPFDGNKWNNSGVLSSADMLEIIRSKYSYVKLNDGVHDTDRKYQLSGSTGHFSFISTMSDAFCSGCNRIRLTADGKIKNCLFSLNEIDILSAFRKGENIESLVRESIYKKAEKLGGQFEHYADLHNPAEISNREMIRIGG